MNKYLILILILIFGFFLRIYGLNWDQGYHLHPDERAIVMSATPLQFPKSIDEFLSPQSSWNPHFFAYGSFPLYLLKTAGSIAGNFDPSFGLYDKINLIGRFLSSLFDLGTLFMLFLLGKKLFNTKIALFGAFFYGLGVLPIQLSHFYAVDTILTFFVLSTLYQCIRLYEKPTITKSLLVGFFFGLSLATKISATVLLSSIGMTLIIDFLLIFLKNPHRPHIWFPHIPKLIKTLFTDGVIIVITTLISFLVFEPYALIDFQEFWRQTLQQSQMTHDAFTFPYTLQYVNKIPYFYELKNIFLWGQGPILATVSFIGIFYTLLLVIKKQKEKKWAQELILIIFLISYFAVVGKFAVGWMRYMLPLYPLLCLFAAVLTYKISILIKHKLGYWYLLVVFVFIGSILAWPLSFMNIYNKPNTRVLASEWINQNIPHGSTLAIEHWDDGLPLFGQQNYQILTLSLYDPDTAYKWEIINEQLKQTDYIIIASNRLYMPLMKLTNCEKLPVGRCYTKTNEYYKKLFNESLGFKKVAEFSVYPKIPILNIDINDESADESFTVYDHPKVMIFKKIP